MLKRMLLPLGGSATMPVAIQHAVDLATRHGAEITGLAIMDEDRLADVGPVPMGGAAMAHELREHRRAEAKERMRTALTSLAVACQAGNTPHRIVEIHGEPIEAMVRFGRYHDLVVGCLRSLFEFGIVDEPPDELVKLVTSGVRPIFAVGPTYHAMQRVLIAYSGSVESAKTLKQYTQLGLWPDAHLKIVTFDELQSEGEERLADAAEYCRTHGLKPEIEYLAGDPKTSLLPYAKQWNADLLVVGNSAKNLLYRKIFGETALNVIRNAELPLFLSQ